MLQRLLHLVEQFLLFHRLGQEAECAHLRGLNGIGNGAVRGQQDHLETGPSILQLLQQADAVELVHAQVRDDQVRSEAAGRRQRQHAVLYRFDVVVLGPQTNRQQAQQPGIIVHHQNAGFALLRLIHCWPPRVGCIALGQITLDVRNRVELGLRIFQLLAQADVFVHFGLQMPLYGGTAFPFRTLLGVLRQFVVLCLEFQLGVDLRQLDQRDGTFERLQRLGLRCQLAQQLRASAGSRAG